MRKIYPENVRRITATVGGKTYHFKSEGEFLWSQYLQFLKQSGEIADWQYEPPPFFFTDIRFGPVQYKLDFLIQAGQKQHYYQEFKRGFLDGQAVTKLRRMADQHPDVIIELVMMGIGKRFSHRQTIAQKYVRRIINADIIFKQLGRLIISAKEYQAGKNLQKSIDNPK
jgi:hypothetical protein